MISGRQPSPRNKLRFSSEAGESREQTYSRMVRGFRSSAPRRSVLDELALLLMMHDVRRWSKGVLGYRGRRNGGRSRGRSLDGFVSARGALRRDGSRRTVLPTPEDHRPDLRTYFSLAVVSGGVGY